MNRRGCAVSLAVLLALLLGGSDADAAFPGVNGRIAYTVSKTVCRPGIEDESCSTVMQIWTIRADGSGRRLVRAAAGHPSFAPGGRWLAAEEGGDTVVLDLRTGRARGTLAVTTEAAWSPSGRWLVSVAPGEANSRVLYRSHPDGSGRRQITRGSSDRPCPAGCPVRDVSSPAWSSHNEVAFARVDPGHADVQGIARMRPDGSGLRVLTGGPADSDPDWSPNGRRIVFSRRSETGRGDLWSMTRGGRGLRRLTRGRANDRRPVWSPDGRLIAFSRDNALWIMDVRGRRAHRVRGAGTRGLLALDWEALR